MQGGNSFGGNMAAANFQQGQPLMAPPGTALGPESYGWGAPSANQYSIAPNQRTSAQTYQGPGPGGTKAPAGECEDECAEEECDPDQCGDENRGPKASGELPCGIDTRPFLPLGLIMTTFLGGLCLLLCQLPVVNNILGALPFLLGMEIALFLFLYLVTLGCMVYCYLGDPGQLRRDYSQAYTAMEREGTKPSLPKRAHKTWLYRQPVRRYDHYCRWVTNCIGLLNHRQFIIMVSGLVLLAVLGIAVDLVALTAIFSAGTTWLTRFGVCFHLFYSVVLMTLAGPIFRIHLGLVTRNELASEWKRNDFYVVEGAQGELIPVNTLSDDEFNQRFDNDFVYDKSKNAFDQGWQANCYSFWCSSRASNQLGEF